MTKRNETWELGAELGIAGSLFALGIAFSIDDDVREGGDPTRRDLTKAFGLLTKSSLQGVSNAFYLLKDEKFKNFDRHKRCR